MRRDRNVLPQTDSWIICFCNLDRLAVLLSKSIERCSEVRKCCCRTTVSKSVSEISKYFLHHHSLERVEAEAEHLYTQTSAQAIS